MSPYSLTLNFTLWEGLAVAFLLTGPLWFSLLYWMLS